MSQQTPPPSGTRTHTIKLMKDYAIEIPQLWMDVYVEGDRSEQVAFGNWLSRSNCHKASDPDVADVVIFTGGDDVDPALYGKDRHPQTFIDSGRDKREMELYLYCLENGIPMMGVCRGAQFLHVMNGGKLYQHVDGHNGKHSIYDTINHERIFPVSSVHHQMCKYEPDSGMLVLADALNSQERWLDDKEKETGRIQDVEAFWYRDSVCLGFQGHPEYSGYATYSVWCLERMNEYLIMNPDLEVRGRYRRVKEDILAERLLIETDKLSKQEVVVN